MEFVPIRVSAATSNGDLTWKKRLSKEQKMCVSMTDTPGGGAACRCLDSSVHI